MWAFLAEAVGSFLLGWLGKLLGRRQAVQEGRKEQAAADAQATVQQGQQAARNASDVAGMSDAELDAELGRDARHG